jgi:hypothetical protein
MLSGASGDEEWTQFHVCRILARVKSVETKSAPTYGRLGTRCATDESVLPSMRSIGFQPSPQKGSALGSSNPRGRLSARPGGIGR